MAKNYSLAEAVQVLLENEDTAAIADIGRRYPLLAVKITRVAVKAGEEFGDLMQFMPENLSANKINGTIKKALEDAGDEGYDEEGADDGADDGEEEGWDETPKAKKAAKAPAKAAGKKATSDTSGDTDYDNWNNAKMYKLLGELGLRKDCKEKFGDLSHDAMLKYLKKYVPDGKPVEAADDEEDVEATEEQDYTGMKAIDLYKLCKERKIKAEQKKPAKYYIDLLKKADAAATNAEEDADNEGWDDEGWDDETPAPKKPAKKAEAKSAAKGKKPAKEADDEEDWEI